MTRVNCVPPGQLHSKFLMAEYHEIPRVLTLVHKAQEAGKTPADCGIPDRYVLGAGHVRFFYVRCLWIARRIGELADEMRLRGMEPRYGAAYDRLVDLEAHWCNDWVPDDQALYLNRLRLAERSRDLNL